MDGWNFRLLSLAQRLMGNSPEGCRLKASAHLRPDTVGTKGKGLSPTSLFSCCLKGVSAHAEHTTLTTGKIEQIHILFQLREPKEPTVMKCGVWRKRSAVKLCGTRSEIRSVAGRRLTERPNKWSEFQTKASLPSPTGTCTRSLKDL